jgi:hypothetical protein
MPRSVLVVLEGSGVEWSPSSLYTRVAGGREALSDRNRKGGGGGEGETVKMSDKVSYLSICLSRRGAVVLSLYCHIVLNLILVV